MWIICVFDLNKCSRYQALRSFAQTLLKSCFHRFYWFFFFKTRVCWFELSLAKTKCFHWPLLCGGYLISIAYWLFSLSSANFFQNQIFFEKKIQEYHQSAKQFGSRSGPTFWFPTVCKSYQQMTLVGQELRWLGAAFQMCSFLETCIMGPPRPSMFINPLPAGNFSPLFCCPLIFFKINFFEKFFQEYHQSVKKVWIQIRPEVMSGLIWVQTVCKSYQLMTVKGDWMLPFRCVLFLKRA